jgi:NAD(P)-dependent dehydrogenase (short-subunit alcohol dehydrogenase family)
MGHPGISCGSRRRDRIPGIVVDCRGLDCIAGRLWGVRYLMTNTPGSTNTAQAGKVWFITGTSTGFGRLLAEEVLKAGGRVLATARKTKKIADLEERYPEAARTFALDVTKPAQIETVAKDAIAAFGRMDVLVNNAGYGIAGGIEEAAESEFMPVFETNVFGLMRVTRAFLPQFRKQRSGHILNISSMAGLVGSPGWGYYNASKFAVEGFSEALAGEMAPLGVKVTIVEPGPFRTDFLGRSGVMAERKIPDYEETVGKTREYFYGQPGKQRGDPLKAVHAMMDVVESPNPPLHLILGALAYNRFRGKLDQWRDEMAAYESVTLGADFPEGQ